MASPSSPAVVPDTTAAVSAANGSRSSTSQSLQSRATVRILLTGASGYVGQHILQTLMKWPPPLANEEEEMGIDQRYEITALYHSSEKFPQALLDYQKKGKEHCHSNFAVIPKPCNLADYKENDGDSYDICIHAAAMSSPRACQNDPEKAYALNCPEGFLKATKNIPLFIAFSSDQVYDGKQEGRKNEYYKEEDLTEAMEQLNVYAKSKVKLEDSLRELRGGEKSPLRTVVLRSSIVVGPKAPISPEDAHDTFFHFCSSRNGIPTDLWANEYRSIVGVEHVCQCISNFICHKAVDSEYAGGYDVYNLGGPEKLNRYEIGLAVFDYFGYDPSCLGKANQTSPTVPIDISMDSSKLATATGIPHRPSNLKGLVEYVFREVK